MVHTVLLKKYISLNGDNNLQECYSPYSSTSKKNSIHIPVHYPTGSSTLQIVGVHMRLIISPEEERIQSHVESANRTNERDNADEQEYNTEKRNMSNSTTATVHQENSIKLPSKSKFEYFSSSGSNNNSSNNIKNNNNDNTDSMKDVDYKGNAVNEVRQENTENVHKLNHDIHTYENSHIYRKLNTSKEKLQVTEKNHLLRREEDVDISTSVRVTANVHGESDLESKQFVVGIVQLCSESNESATEKSKKWESSITHNKVTANAVKRVKSDFTNNTSCNGLHAFSSSSSPFPSQMSAFLKLDLRLQVEQLEFDIDVLNVRHVLHSVRQTNNAHDAFEKGKNEKAKQSRRVANAMVEVAIIGAITTLVEEKEQKLNNKLEVDSINKLMFKKFKNF